MHCRRLTALVLTIGALAAGCGGRAELGRPAVGGRVEAARPKLVLPQSPALLSTPTPAETVDLPTPVRIPDDPYAPEPVVQIGTIDIPRIGLTSPIFDGVTLNNIDNGPSHWPGTALPGQPGNVVVAGHRVSHGHPFRRLDELVDGDEVIFTVHGTRTTYRVRLHMVVAPADTWIASQTPAATATLYACHPPGSADKRYVVRLALAA